MISKNKKTCYGQTKLTFTCELQANPPVTQGCNLTLNVIRAMINMK